MWNNDVYFAAKSIYQGMQEVLFQVMLYLFQEDFMAGCDYRLAWLLQAAVLS